MNFTDTPYVSLVTGVAVVRNNLSMNRRKKKKTIFSKTELWYTVHET